MIHSLLNLTFAATVLKAEISFTVLLPVAIIIVIRLLLGRNAVFMRWMESSDEQRMQLRLDEIDHAMKLAPDHLSERFVYYTKLSESGKKKFLARLRFILSTKYFVSKEGQSLSPEVELMTGAAFVQATFGLKTFHLPRFQRIVVFPDIFYNKLLDRNLRGGTSPSGIIRFSWKHIEHGYAIADDNMNLALHELAHAMMISAQKDDAIDEAFKAEVEKFSAVTIPFRSAILEGKLNHIRKYAGTNEHEFFACCVEYFFESPQHFQEHIPKLYKAMCEVLGQDPTNEDGDYALIGRAFEADESVYRRYLGRFRHQPPLTQDDSGSWIGWMIVLGGLIGVPFTLVMSVLTDSSAVSVLLFLASVAVLGSVLFWRRFLVTGFMSSGSFSGFIIFGWMPIVASLAMLANQFVPVYTAKEVEKVTAVRYVDYAHRVYCMESGYAAARDGMKITAEKAKWVDERIPNVQAVVDITYGVFGLKSITGVTFREKPSQ